MSRYVDRIVATIHEAEEALSEDVRDQQKRWRYSLHQRRVWFDKEVRHAHKQLKQGIPSFLRHGSVLNLLTTPIIYSLSLPFVLLDFWVSLYQWICFPIYGIDRVARRRYFVIDRHKLGYLNAIEKANCMYCSYANGVVAYVREIAGRTEQYWCPSSMHERSRALITTTSCSSTTETLRAIAAGWPASGRSLAAAVPGRLERPHFRRYCSRRSPW